MRAHALFTFAVLGSAVFAQDTHNIAMNPTVGVKESHRMKFVSSINAGGQNMEMIISMIATNKVTKIEGDIVTYEGSMSDFKMLMNGQEFPAGPEGNMTSTIQMTKRGALIKTDTSAEMAPPPRLEQASRFLYPEGPVKVGDSWFREVKEDAKLGFVEAKAKYTLEKLEMKEGVNTYRIKYAYSELKGNAPTDCIGTYWIEVGTGSLVAFEAQMHNLAFVDEMPPVDSTISMVRVKPAS